MRIVVINHLSLDGVMQSPGHAEEDTRGGFAHGGWAAGTDDPKVMAAIGERMGAADGLLLGRRSYEGMLGGWNERGGPFKDALNAMTKYVVSHSGDTQLPWPNSTLVSGDVPAAVGEMRERESGNLVVMGSGELLRTLLPAGLIDELLLILHPLMLGEGLRLFEHEDESVPLRLTKGEAVDGGVILATYEPR